MLTLPEHYVTTMNNMMPDLNKNISIKLLFQLLLLLCAPWKCTTCAVYYPNITKFCPADNTKAIDCLRVTEDEPFFCLSNTALSPENPCGVIHLCQDGRLDIEATRRHIQALKPIQGDEKCPKCDDSKTAAMSKQKDWLCDLMES